MLSKFIIFINSFYINNYFIFKFYNFKFKKLEYSFNFHNENFENEIDIKKILFTKKNLQNKNYDEKNISYYNFHWLNVAKKIGGSEIILLSKKHIINWYQQNKKIYTFIWNEQIVAKRLINLIYNYDFYAVSATEEEKKIIKSIIIRHYLKLKSYLILKKNNSFLSIETCKALLLFHLINNLKNERLLVLIYFQIESQIDENGMHKSINPCFHAEFINHLYEIKNLLLFFNINETDKIEKSIISMISVLKNLFHKDKTISLFNGSNNSNITQIKNINKLYKDLKTKNMTNINNGLAIFESKNLKIFFDVAKPTNKLLSQNLHAGTLSFELSYDGEKIITNCGSIEKRIGKRPEFLRYSAAHSTIILNNTNISELVAKRSYKRAPKKISMTNNETNESLIWEAIHDGYNNNYKKIIKRKLKIDKKNPIIFGEDSIISSKINSKKLLYNIRFHLTPSCSCIITNDKKTVFIKTKKKHSWAFKSSSKLTLEDSIYINDGKSVSTTKQIVISGILNYSKTA